MANQDCLNAAKSVAGEDLTDRQLTEIMDVLEAKANRAMREDPAMSQRDALSKAGAELTAERKLAVLIAKRSRAYNVAAKMEREKFYAEVEAQGMSRADAIRALNVGIEGPFSGAGKSVDAMTHALEAQMVGPMLEELRLSGLLDVAEMKNPEFELMVAREMARANGDETVQSTGNRHAKKMADIFVKYQEAGRVRQNGAGAFIRKMPGYVARQSHDQIRIYKAGKEAWKAKILPKLHPRTFDGIKNIDEFLDETWSNLASGNHEKSGGGSDWLGGFEGPGNLAKRASAERVLHFKDSDAWIEYNNEFGKSSLFEAVTDSLRYSARNTALMRVWGTNPEAAFKADVKQAVATAKKAGRVEEVAKISGWLTQAQFDEVSGGVQVRGSPSLAAWAGTVRGITNMATLGGVVVSAIPDLAIRAAVLRHNGVPLARAYAETVKTVLSAFQTTQERASVARMLNIGTQGILGGLDGRFHATDTMPGTIGKMNTTYFKWTLLTGWTDAWSRGTGLILANEMGGAAASGRAWDGFNGLHQATLRRYGIGEAEWGLLQQAEIHKADGDAFLMPENVRALPDEVFAGYLGGEPNAKQIAKAREDLTTSLSTYYTDQVREALTFGGAKERAILSLGTERGTPRGEAVRMMTQFKQFPLTMYTKHITRELKRGGETDIAGIAHMIAATTALGVVSYTAKMYGRGQEWEEPEDAGDWGKVLMAGMTQGGGLGIYGDFLFGSFSRTGTSVLETMAGPSAGLAQKYIDVLNGALHGQDTSAKAVKAVVGTLPYNNLFGARLALDHMVLHGLQEQLNPGYLRRYQRQQERDNGVRYWLEPTTAWNK
jgi:hypothetical protein